MSLFHRVPAFAAAFAIMLAAVMAMLGASGGPAEARVRTGPVPFGAAAVALVPGAEVPGGIRWQGIRWE